MNKINHKWQEFDGKLVQWLHNVTSKSMVNRKNINWNWPLNDCLEEMHFNFMETSDLYDKLLWFKIGVGTHHYGILTNSMKILSLSSVLPDNLLWMFTYYTDICRSVNSYSIQIYKNNNELNKKNATNN